LPSTAAADLIFVTLPAIVLNHFIETESDEITQPSCDNSKKKRL
jgi:hypothetical protein